MLDENEKSFTAFLMIVEQNKIRINHCWIHKSNLFYRSKTFSHNLSPACVSSSTDSQLTV